MKASPIWYLPSMTTLNTQKELRIWLPVPEEPGLKSNWFLRKSRIARYKNNVLSSFAENVLVCVHAKLSLNPVSLNRALHGLGYSDTDQTATGHGKDRKPTTRVNLGLHNPHEVLAETILLTHKAIVAYSYSISK